MWRRKKADGPDKPSAYGKALGLLSRRERSSKELERRLDREGYESADADAALTLLREQSFLDDTRFAGALVRLRIGQGFGPRRITAELRTHGLVDTEIRAQPDLADADWTALARQLYRRRFGGRPADDPAERNRRASFLLRRGFDAATVRIITHANDVDDSADEFD